MVNERRNFYMEERKYLNGITKWVMDQAILQEMLYMHF